MNVTRSDCANSKRQKTTEISWRPTEDTEIHTVKCKGSSRRRKGEAEKKDKN